MLKGYLIQHTRKFVLTNDAIRRAVDPGLVHELERAPPLNPSGWYPRQEQVRLWRAIAATQPDEKSARETLIQCGAYAGTEATGTFLKLLFKVLTPKMFASKFPDFYKRDHQGGEGVVEEVADKRVVLSARDVAGYDHFGPNTVGWAGVGFRAMGLKNLSLTCSPWSLAEPGPPEVRFVATWT